MAWFIVHSWLIIIPSFVLGLLVGWLWWGRQSRKVSFGESEAVQAIARQHQAIEADKDAEITRLRALLSARTETPVTSAAEADTAAETATAADADPEPVVVPVPVPVPAPIPADLNGAPDAVPPAADEQVTEAFASDPTVDDSAPVGEAAQSDADLNDTTPVGEADQSDADLNDSTPVTEASTSDTTDAADAQAPPVTEEPAGDETPETPPAPAQAVAVDAEEDPDDDLERVEGIGPRIAGALRAAGIRTFAALAAADVPTLQAALEASGLRFAPSLPTWARQAGFLAAGDEEGFVALTDSLVAGRSSSRRS